MSIVAPEIIVRLTEEQARSGGPGSGYAVDPGYLNVFGTIGCVLLLTPAGKVLVDHHDDEGIVEATPEEREFAHVRAASGHPELRALMPPRPADAVDCPLCHGAGSVPLPDGHRVFCGAEQCNSRGWVPPHS